MNIDENSIAGLNQKTLLEATYTPQELAGIPYYKYITQRDAYKDTTGAGLAPGGNIPAPTSSVLRPLEQALRVKQEIGNQPLGESEAFKQAGLDPYATLTQSLQQHSQDIDYRYTSFANVMGEVGGSLRDTYNSALQGYQMASAEYNQELERIDKVVQRQQDYEDQLKLLEVKNGYDKESAQFNSNLILNRDVAMWQLENGETGGLNVYLPSASLEGIQSGVDPSGKLIFNEGIGAYQCGAFVNRVWGIAAGGAGGFGDLYSNKQEIVNNRGITVDQLDPTSFTQTIKPGMAFVSQAGKTGHVGIVTQVFSDGTFTTMEANVGDNNPNIPDPPIEKKRSIKDSDLYGFAFPPEGSYKTGQKQLKTDEAQKLDKELRSTDEYKSLNKALVSYNALQEFKKTWEESGSDLETFGGNVGKLNTTYRSALLNMKEFFNLGVLNGPDLEIMEQVIPNPTSLTERFNALTFRGGADAVTAGIENMEKQLVDTVNERYGTIQGIYGSHSSQLGSFGNLNKIVTDLERNGVPVGEDKNTSKNSFMEVIGKTIYGAVPPDKLYSLSGSSNMLEESDIEMINNIWNN